MANITASPAYEAVKLLTKRVGTLRTEARTRSRTLRIASANRRPHNTPEVEREQRLRRETAQAAILAAEVALRVGAGTQEAVDAAKADLAALEALLNADAYAAQVRELALIEGERDLIQEQLEQAQAELAREAADEIRPQVTHWLEAMAGFLEANEALAAACDRLTAAGVPAPVKAVQDVILQTTEGSRSRLAWLLSNPHWSTYYAAEIQAHKSLTAEHTRQRRPAGRP